MYIIQTEVVSEALRRALRRLRKMSAKRSICQAYSQGHVRKWASKAQKVSFQQPHEEQVGDEAHEDIEGLEICVDLGPVEVFHSVERRQPTNQDGLTVAANGNFFIQPSSFSVAEDYSRDSAVSIKGLIRATIAAETTLDQSDIGNPTIESVAVERELVGRGIDGKEVGVTVMDSEEELVQTTIADEEPGQVDSVEEDASPMITQVQEGLGVEELSTKIICHEQVSSKRGRRELGDVEDEVTKTLETGTTLGFDFIDVEEEVMEAIARREEEDAANFEALNGH
ncbi:hypothetical protein LWI29_034891 [Acer saccharum]|uniref:Uncharacterized protein n=1 Tax=Acer saccharum TaxID=4024 RepID=A0AA39W7L2_ACESA|nr:hypothetical protein LWI29_034891 [Acer saccharum]